MIIKIIIKKFEELVKERLDEIKDTNQNDLTYYFKDNTARKKLMISIMVYNFAKT